MTARPDDSLQRQGELDYLREHLWEQDDPALAGSVSAAMRPVLEKVRLVAPTRSTVLLEGETGTGKGVIARLLHRHSTRADGPFIAVHCGAIPDTLLESELFGYEPGAFTGAAQRRLGRFEIAAGGTLFLDEIGTLTLTTQVKLLQVIQERAIVRLGGETSVPVDVRIVAAGNEDLEELCAAGRFRRDLYYRLNVFPIRLPPLRERLADIPLLADAFRRQYSRYHARNVAAIDPAVLAAFERYAWPGNIRELENVVERGVILESGASLSPASVPAAIMGDRPAVGTPATTLAVARRHAVHVCERTYLDRLLAAHAGRLAAVAAAAGISTRQLHTLMRRHGLDKRDYRG